RAATTETFTFSLHDALPIFDIADSHVRALMEIDRVSGEAFNVGNSRGYSILEVIDVAERVTGRKIPRKLGQRRPGDPAVLVASKDRKSTRLNSSHVAISYAV